MRNLVLAVFAALLIASPISAGKTKPYLNATPGSPVAPATFTLSGCGFVDGDVYVTVWHNPTTGGYTGLGTVGVSQEAEDVEDAGGCASFTFSTADWGSDLAAQRGGYQVTAYQHHGPIAANYLVVTFTVS